MKSLCDEICLRQVNKNAIFRCIVRKSPDLPADAYLAYVYSHIAYSKHKNTIFRCITRKKHRGQTAVYLAYIRVALGVSDDVRR